MADWTLYEGDCLEVMATLPAESVDAVVTDPPYELGFMGQAWDRQGIAYRPELWSAVLRLLKPGGHLLAFGGTRTYHRLACAIEDAGFEVRDCLMWLYGSGFPKSLDVSKAIDKKFGAEREVVGPNPYSSPGRKPGVMHIAGGNQRPAMEARMAKAGLDKPLITAPATPEAKRWDGWGTALKPAVEPIILARKPLSEATVAENVLKWGTGALNIDGCRIGENAGWCYPHGRGGKGWGGRESLSRNLTVPISANKGRWPANVLLDEEAAAMLDEQSGIRQGGARPARRGPGTKGYHGWPNGTNDGVRIKYESGGASRFFYVAKPSRSERTMGGKVENNHPTVKPIKLHALFVPPHNTS